MDRQILDVIKSRVKLIVPYALKAAHAKIKINQNESPYDLPDEIKNEILRRVQQLPWSRYPDSVPLRTLDKLSQFAGWPSEGILIGNGSNEMIQAILSVIVERGRRVLIPQPSFTLYKLIGSVLGGNIIEVPLSETLCYDVEEIKRTIQRYRPEIFIFASPNNPTGCSIAEDELEEILKSFTGLVVVDEAYYEFSGRTVQKLLSKYENLVITRSFSNALSMAGLRLGYLLAHPETVEQIAKAKLPYNVNIFSLTAGEVILEHLDLLRARIREIIEQREKLYQELRTIPGVNPYRSHANFMVFESDRNPELLFNDLLARDILVRDVSHYPLLSKALRVTVGTPEENQAFLNALRDILGSAKD